MPRGTERRHRRGPGPRSTPTLLRMIPGRGTSKGSRYPAGEQIPMLGPSALKTHCWRHGTSERSLCSDEFQRRVCRQVTNDGCWLRPEAYDAFHELITPPPQKCTAGHHNDLADAGARLRLDEVFRAGIGVWILTVLTWASLGLQPCNMCDLAEGGVAHRGRCNWSATRVAPKEGTCCPFLLVAQCAGPT